MGSAIVRGAIASRALSAADIIIAEVNPTRRDALRSLGCPLVERAAEAAAADQILLAVKPQAFADAASEIAPSARGKVVISIMAGLSSRAIRQALGANVRVVRAMPNVACQVGQGMTALALGDGAKPGDEALAMQLFGSLGATTMVDESLMYAVTAVSGSGPAYVFLLAEAMERAATQLGIDAPTARLLVEQTVRGAGVLLVESGRGSADLRTSVTSPGGTTAAALAAFDKLGFTRIVLEALKAARDRGLELDQV